MHEKPIFISRNNIPDNTQVDKISFPHSLFLPLQTKSVSVGQLDEANKVVQMALDLFNILVSFSPSVAQFAR